MTESRSAISAQSRRGAFAVLLVILSCAALLRFTSLDDPLGGYHSMNEAWHVIMARNFDNSSFLRPRAVGVNVDLKIRALYVYAVYGCFRIFGESPAVARAVSAVSGLFAVLLLFGIGARIAGTGEGLAAAAIIAVSPIHTVLSRNAQPDAMALTLTLAAAWLWLAARDRKSRMLMIVSGLVWGAAVFTKNFAVLLLPAIVFHEIVNHGFRAAIKNMFFFALPALIIPAPFLIYNIATNAAGVVAIYRQIVLHAPDGRELIYMAQEMIWALSPVVFALALAGLTRAPMGVLKKSALVWAAALVFLGQYFFQHVHSYYFLSAVPFLILSAAQCVMILPRMLKYIVLTLAIAASLAQTTLSSAAMQHDFSRFRDAAHKIESWSQAGTVFAPKIIINNYGPVLHYYLPRFHILTQEDVPVEPKTGRLKPDAPRPFLFISPVASKQQSQHLNPKYQSAVIHRFSGFCIGGRVLYMLPRNPHSFIPHAFGTAAPFSGSSRFGYAPFAQQTSLIIHRIPDNADILFQKDGNGNASYKFEYRRTQQLDVDPYKK